MTGIVQDLVYAVRGLRKDPGVTAVAVLTLALGIGGATTIFSIADAVVLRPLPYEDSGRLVVVWQTDRERHQPFLEVSYPAFREWHDRSRLFTGLAGMPAVNQEVLLMDRGDATALEGRWVTGDFFSVLGVGPALGRTLLPADDTIGAPGVVVLSHGLWRDRFGGDASVIGESMMLNGRPHTIVGVMPAGFAYPRGAQFWIPLTPAAGRLIENDGVQWMIALGRLRPGVTPAAAQRELSEIWRQLHRPYFPVDGFASVLTSFSETIFGPSRPALFALLGAVGLVLLMACANVAGLLLVRGTKRRFDIALRHSLGASRGRLAFSALAESSVLALLGGAGGLLVAVGGIPLMVALSPADVPRIDDVVMSTRAFVFAVVVSGVAALLSALAPMALASRTSLTALSRHGTQRIVSGRTRVGASLVVAEIATAVVVVVFAGLIVRSFVNLQHVPLGYNAENLLTIRISPKGQQYADHKRVSAFYQELLTRVRTLPGVQAAAAITHRPLWSTVGYDGLYTAEGQSEQEASRNPMLNAMSVSADYFRTMGISVKRGRAFTDRDREGQPGVVVISESLARRVWPGQEAIGKRLKIPLPTTPYDNAWLTVVGIVEDARYRELQAARLDFYMSHLQADDRLNYLMVRTGGEPAAIASAVRAIVRGLDRTVPVTDITPMHQIVSQALGNPRFAATTFGVFALMALVLAALGVHGLLAYSVTCRTQEIGVRMALGAQLSDVLRSVLGSTARMTLIGTTIGLALAALSGRMLESLLFGVTASDLVTFVTAPAILAVTALLACLAPALRAARVDPLIALRYE